MNSKLMALAAGALAMGTGAIAIVGVLLPLAQELNVSAAAAGQLVVAYSLAFAITAPLAAFGLARWCRRRVLLLGLGLFIAGALISMLAPSYTWLIAGRVLAGIGAAVFTPNATVVASVLVPPEQRGRAIATVFGGFTLASVFGVPLGTWIGNAAGWRATMAFTLLLGVLALAAVAWQLRGRVQAPAAQASQWLAMLREPLALGLLAVTGVAMAGTYVVFAFIAPFLAGYTVPSALGTAVLLMVLGGAGALGTFFAGRVIDRFGAPRMVTVTLATAAAGLLLLAFGGNHAWALLIGLVAWGAGAFAANAAQQARLVAFAPQLAGALLPANASVLYVGQALGGVAGALLVQGQGAALLQRLPLAGALFVGAALVLSLWLARQPAPATLTPALVPAR